MIFFSIRELDMAQHHLLCSRARGDATSCRSNSPATALTPRL
jgi:hypothetical protein